MRALKITKYALLALLVIAMALFLHYNLPRTDVVQITGTDVKRVDKRTGKTVTLDETGGDGKRLVVATRDVRFISTVTREGKVKVFRNEDTGWGWPPYFKFDSADITAEAQAYLTADQKPWVLVKYYGWRIKVFSMFPNVISLKVVGRDYRHVPWFNIVILTLLAIALFFVVRTLRRLLERVRHYFGWGRPAGGDTET